MKQIKIEDEKEISESSYRNAIESSDVIVNADDLEYGTRILILGNRDDNYLIIVSSETIIVIPYSVEED